MAIPKPLMALAVIVVLWFVATAYFGAAGFIGMLAIVVGGLALVKWLNILPIGQFFPLNKTYSMYTTGLCLVVLALSMGWLAGVQLPTGQLNTNVNPLSNQVTTGNACYDEIAKVNPDILKKASTIDVNAFDQESTTPYSAAVDTNAFVFVNGVYKTTMTDTSATTLSAAVGDTLYVAGGNGTYYIDSVDNYCVDGERPTLELGAHTVVSSTDLSTTAYDDSGSAALTTGSNTSCEDYYITLGANGEQVVYLKVKVDAAAHSFRLGGVAVAPLGNVKTVEPSGSDKNLFTKIATPANFSKITVSINDTVMNGGNATGLIDYQVYKLKTPVLLHQWESAKYQFTITAGATDPARVICNASSGNQHGVAFVWLDAVPARGTDGAIYDDVYTHVIGETNVGLAENMTNPIGKYGGTYIGVA